MRRRWLKRLSENVLNVTTFIIVAGEVDRSNRSNY